MWLVVTVASRLCTRDSCLSSTLIELYPTEADVVSVDRVEPRHQKGTLQDCELANHILQDALRTLQQRCESFPART